MPPGQQAMRWHVRFAFAVALGAVFWVPALPAARGWFPAPLDDVYIHFDYARSLAAGHPFEWIPGQGYSSGETSPLYALVLSIGAVLGMKGKLLGVWAAVVAASAVASLHRSVEQLAGRLPLRLGPLVALVPFSIAIVDWSLFSGMEVALFVAALGRALVAVDRARAPAWRRRGGSRERAQWLVGVWGAALVLLRPEAGALVAVFAVVTARGAGVRSGALAVARAAIPGALATSLLLGMNLLATGDPRAAGAQLKLLSSNPFFSDADRARVFLEHLVALYVKLLRGELAFAPAAGLALPALALVGLISRERRSVAAACILGAIAWTLLVSWNMNAPHHNFRYYVPAIVLFTIAAALGLATIARRGRLGRGIAAVATVGVVASASTRIPSQVEHFALATENIRDQHVELGTRIARLPEDVRVLVGDAGAIPFVSKRTAIDALGLGGYRRLPFARAAVNGEAATIELIERLSPEERPTHLALYPNWFSKTTSRFGTEIDRVTIEKNVICGGPTKALYRADFGALDVPRPPAPEIVDEIDVGDVVSEEEHEYVSPAPNGGWTTLEILLDREAHRRFDGGRIIPAGGAESFVVRRAPGGAGRVVLRTDARPGRALVRTSREEKEIAFATAQPGSWTRGTATLEVLAPGDRVEIVAVGVELRDYHVFIERAD